MILHPSFPLAPTRHRSPDRLNDDQVLSLVLGLIGGVRVAIAVATREAFAAEATVALLMMGWSFALFISNHHRQTQN